LLTLLLAYDPDHLDYIRNRARQEPVNMPLTASFRPILGHLPHGADAELRTPVQYEQSTLILRDRATDLNPAARVGICPDCGYPSLESILCAFCRPRLAL